MMTAPRISNAHIEGVMSMRSRFVLFCTGALVALTVACSPAKEAPPAQSAAPPAPKLGIRPAGDTEIQPDLSQMPERV